MQQPEMHMPASGDSAEYLEYLREAYVHKVNAALERGRDDLAAELADDYLDEVRRALEGVSPPRG
jgi:phage shock protein A